VPHQLKLALLFPRRSFPCTMGGKAKPTKHTSAELKAKDALHKPRGGGAAGQAERKVDIKFTCVVCKAQMPSITNLRTHYENKHPKEAFPEETYAAMDVKKEKVCVHHNQASLVKSNKNASRSVRDKVKETNKTGAVVDESRKKVYAHTAVGGPSTL